MTIKNNYMNWDADLIDDIILSINSNRIVPLIGSGAFYIQESTKNLSVQEYIVRESIGVLNNAGVNVKLTDDNKQQYCCGYKGFTNLSKLFVGTPKTFKKTIRKIVSDSDFKSKIKLDPKVEEFINLGHFPLILTTCVFPCLVDLLPRYKNNCRVYQLEGTPDQGLPTDIATTPCLYYLFGNINDSLYQEVVLTEKDYLKFLYHIQDTKDGPKNLKEYLTPQKRPTEKVCNHGVEKYIFSIGCDVPDWTYRFLIISLKAQNGDLNYPGRKEDSFLGGVLTPHIDECFDEFLASIGYYSEEDLDGLLENVNNKMNELPSQKKPSIFLSVNSGDDYKHFGDKIETLLKNDFTVWYFPKDGKKRYWDSIKKGLKECQLFMPIVTNTTIEKLDLPREVPEPDKEVGIITEYHEALEEMRSRGNGVLYCIPYILQTSREILKNTLIRESCPNKDLFDLFFPGNEAITTPIENFSVNELIDYIKNAYDGTED